MLLYSVLRLLEYVRVYPEVSMMIRLLKKVISDSYIFFFYFFCWVACFSYLLKISGASEGTDDYFEVSNGITYGLNTLRNSIGDMQIPTTDYWNKQYKQHPYLVSFMVGYAWTIWLGNAVFLLIILLNFLIALIS